MRIALVFLTSIILFSCQLTRDTSSATSVTSKITCPHCGYTSLDTLPTEYCVIGYDCKSCGVTLHPEGDDCCVYCTYGTHKCPSKQ